VLLNPFCPLSFPFSAAKVLALKATVLLLLTLLIKARVQIVAGSALGIALLLLQVLVFLAVSGALVLAAGEQRFSPRNSAGLQRPDVDAGRRRHRSREADNRIGSRKP
jgi:hypothetical protein